MIFPLFAMESPMLNTAADLFRNHNVVLNVKEKAYLKQVCNLLIFEAGACITACKYSDPNNIHTQVKCVSEQKCRTVDIACDFYRDTLSHLSIHPANESLLKLSLTHDTLSGDTKYKGLMLWNTFKGSKAEFLNVWMPNYNLMSGQTNWQ